MSKPLTPDHIMQVGMGFWASKSLLSAVELGLFTELAKNKANCDELRKTLGLHERGALDFFDTLVSLGFLSREDGIYQNTPETDFFLDKQKPSYIGGILEMANHRLYGFWGHLTEGLQTGHPQNEIKNGENLFEKLYEEPARLKEFLKAMTGVSMGSAMAMAQKFPWKNHQSFIDIGCAQGALPVQLALAHPHLRGQGYDLAPAQPIFEEFVASFNLSDRVTFHQGDFFQEELPSADVITMGHILHDWNMEEKMMLLKKAYKALPEGGALIVYEALIDDERKTNAFGLMMSLNMLIETPGGFDYTGADCCQWMTEVGFKDCRVEHLVGPDSMVVAIK